MMVLPFVFLFFRPKRGETQEKQPGVLGVHGGEKSWIINKRLPKY